MFQMVLRDLSVQKIKLDYQTCADPDKWTRKFACFAALLRVVADCPTAALNPRRDAMNESPLKIALFSLVKMSAYPLCRQFIRSSELFPFIGQLRQSLESKIANYASFITTKAES